MSNNSYFVYILFNKKDRVLYTGITNDISRRMEEHKNRTNKRSFTSKYNVDKLGYLEIYGDAEVAIAREKQIKAGSREEKIKLIEKMNPHWYDLTNELMNLFMGLKMSWEAR